MDDKAVYFITAEDEFIAANRAKELFDYFAKDVVDELSKEIIDASASKVDEAVSACVKTMGAAATLSLFGGKKVVWMRGVNFINDTRPGKSEATKQALQNLAEMLENLNPAEVVVIISASPVSRIKKFYKDLQKFAECEDYQEKDPIAACVKLIGREAAKLGVKMDYGAPETLAGIVAGNPRMAIQELAKLATYVNCERPISEDDVVYMVPIFGEGSNYEIIDAFYSGNINRRLAAITRYFFANKNASARPIITSLQKQNSTLIQLRSLMDAKVLPLSTGKISGGTLESLGAKFAKYFEGADTKSQYNIFTKNPWLIGVKMPQIAARISLKKLIDYQMSFSDAFQKLIERPSADEEIMRDLFSQP